MSTQKSKPRRVSKWKLAQQEYQSRASYNFMNQQKQGGSLFSQTNDVKSNYWTQSKDIIQGYAKIYDSIKRNKGSADEWDKNQLQKIDRQQLSKSIVPVKKYTSKYTVIASEAPGSMIDVL